MTRLLNSELLLILSTMKGSQFGVGGGKTKLQAISALEKEGINSTIVDGKQKNIILETVL